MKYIIATIMTIITHSAFSQDIHYFSQYFMAKVDAKTKNERRYNIQHSGVMIEDFTENVLVRKATISGTTSIDDVDAFVWYCINNGQEDLYKPYFEHLNGDISQYEEGHLTKEDLVKGKAIKYKQIYDYDGNSFLTHGSGLYQFESEESQETYYSEYKDSLLTVSYGVRWEIKDTIYYSYDIAPIPKEGIQEFYKYLLETLNYPLFARIVGKEGRTYIQFIVNENGELGDFKPLTKEGFTFEKKIIKRLQQYPSWTPAIYNNKPVKTKLVLPVTFKLI